MRDRTVWLDCSLRDGGYQNNWEFPRDVTNRYLKAMADVRADRVELGFRSLSKSGYHGPTAYTSDLHLGSLSIPIGLKVGVMVNASELGEAADITPRLEILFPEESRIHISFVRLAAHFSELRQAIFAASWLAERHYEVAINLMQVSEAPEGLLTSIGSQIPSEAVAVLYLADSLGNLSPKRTAEIFTQVGEGWSGQLGFHAHDNMGLALANSLSALASGANWIDSTIFGMGRGAGNTRSEILLGHLVEHRRGANIDELQRLIGDFFQPLQEKNPWGPSIHYVDAAARGIHPTYIQELTQNPHFSHAEQSNAIELLGSSDSRKYSPSKLEQAVRWVPDFASPKSNWDQKELFSGKSVLLVGGGPSVKENSAALEAFIDRCSPIVLATNMSGDLNEELLDAHVACHPLRLLRDAAFYSSTAARLIAPASLVPEAEREILLRSGRLLDVGVHPTEKVVGAEAGVVSLPSPHVLGYSMLVCLSGGASNVYLAGFDGYDDGLERRLEQQLSSQIVGLGFRGKVIAITSTTLDVEKSSVHGLLS